MKIYHPNQISISLRFFRVPDKNRRVHILTSEISRIRVARKIKFLIINIIRIQNDNEGVRVCVNDGIMGEQRAVYL